MKSVACALKLHFLQIIQLVPQLCSHLDCALSEDTYCIVTLMDSNG